MKQIKKFVVISISLLILVIGVVVLFDPFYQYHKPLPGLKAVLTDKEYQCIGTLRTFDYDALIVGSSVCENYNNKWFDNGFGCNSIKAVRSYGATADLCYLMDIAFRNRAISKVFYNIDPSSLQADTETTYESTGCPMYLYDTNPINDWQYWFNKDVLFEKIPYMIAYSFKSDYDEGDSYNWAQWKYFGEDMALGMYERLEEVSPMMEKTRFQEELDGNISLLVNEVESHPETEFTFFFSPYSMLWWENAIRSGERDAVIYNEEKAIEALLKYENVKIYYYQADEEIITNLDNYMDMIHFSKDINELICNRMIAKEGEITEDNYIQKLDEMYDLTEKIRNEYIKMYFDD